MLPTGLVCLICFSFSGVAGGGWFHLEIVECNGSRPRPQDGPSCKPLLGRWPWLSVLLVAVMLVTLNVSPVTFVSWGFLRLLPRPFHQTLPLSTPNGCPTACPMVGSVGPHPSLCFTVRSLSPCMGTLSLACLYGFYSHSCASQDLPGPWCTQEGLLQLFGGPPCASTVLSRIAPAAFVYSHSLQYVDLLTALGGLESALCSL